MLNKVGCIAIVILMTLTGCMGSDDGGDGPDIPKDAERITLPQGQTPEYFDGIWCSESEQGGIFWTRSPVYLKDTKEILDWVPQIDLRDPDFYEYHVYVNDDGHILCSDMSFSDSTYR